METMKTKIQDGTLPKNVYNPEYTQEVVFNAMQNGDSALIDGCHIKFWMCGIEIRMYYMLKLLFDNSQLFEEPLQNMNDFSLV